MLDSLRTGCAGSHRYGSKISSAVEVGLVVRQCPSRFELSEATLLAQRFTKNFAAAHLHLLLNAPTRRKQRYFSGFLKNTFSSSLPS